MKYEEFVKANKAIKESGRPYTCLTISNVFTSPSGVNTDYVHVKPTEQDIRLEGFINSICVFGMYYVTNPSKLKNWRGFD